MILPAGDDPEDGDDDGDDIMMRIQKILMAYMITILSGGQTKGRIQSNGTGKTKAKEVKEETKKVKEDTKKVKEEAKKVERIVPIVLSGREEGGRSRSREKVSNPFLSGSNGSSNGLKTKQEKEKVSNGNSVSPTKIAPLATEEVFSALLICPCFTSD